MFSWSLIRSLIESRSLQSAYLALFVVPLVARFTTLGIETVGIYFAAVFFAAASILYAAFRPELIGFDKISDAKESGWTTASLVDAIKSVDLSPEDVPSEGAAEGAATQLAKAKDTRDFSAEAFIGAKAHVNTSRPLYRRLISMFLILAISILALVNIGKAVSVVRSLQPNQIEGGIEVSIYFSIGSPVEVDHEAGSGKTKTSTGTLINPDDNGSVVLENDDGKVVHIPKDRVIEIRQSKPVPQGFPN